MVDFTVDTTGRVQHASALESSHPLLAERAVRAVQQWRFRPGRAKGRLVNTHMQVPVIFQLGEEQLAGVDGLLQAAADLVDRAGPEVQADGDNLFLARPMAKLEPPGQPGSAWPENAHVVLLLVIDATGHPLRGHVLDASSADVGAAVLASALAKRYLPRAGGEPDAVSHEILAFSTQRSALRDPALTP